MHLLLKVIRKLIQFILNIWERRRQGYKGDFSIKISKKDSAIAIKRTLLRV